MAKLAGIPEETAIEVEFDYKENIPETPEHIDNSFDTSGISLALEFKETQFYKRDSIAIEVEMSDTKETIEQKIRDEADQSLFQLEEFKVYITTTSSHTRKKLTWNNSLEDVGFEPEYKGGYWIGRGIVVEKEDDGCCVVS
ncbi:hypothetical protein LPJ55_002811 [Coemansia sp. RSA 990]|nr:hypothetical protein LPJ55_002811 [Coemansia sp. RSA 990]